ncbi:MAG: EamA family transporter [Paludibacteraceae bacterium]
MIKQRLPILSVIGLMFLNLLYACVGVGTRYAAGEAFLTQGYVFSFGLAIVLMGIYAVLWQQVLKYIDLSVAYMFKGTSLIFTMLLAYWLFGEPITLHNIIGAAIIILGIILYNLPSKHSGAHLTTNH